ncbi:MAG: PucR family transcriptional regulator [Actinobacteria bacterium]|nr:PucR family transcriptional regulator [Actinomycetota bacterium]
MKLSVWILKKWLERYDPVVSITDGKQTISGARLFSPSITLDDSLIYVGETKDFFHDSTSNEILLINKNDAISIGSGDVGDIFNIVSEAFDFYNSWERTLFGCTRKEHPEQCIISNCYGLLGPMFLIDMSFNLVAWSLEYQEEGVNSIWDELIDKRKLAVDTIYQSKDSPFIRLMVDRQRLRVFEDPLAAPYPHGIMTSYSDCNGNLAGQFIIASKTPITNYELHIASVIDKVLATIEPQPRFNDTLNPSYNSESFIVEPLLSGEATQLDTYKLLIIKNWKAQDSYRIVLVGIDQLTNDSVLQSFTDMLRSHIPNGIVAFYNHYIVCLVNTTKDDKAIFAAVSEIQKEIPLRFGISEPFHELLETSYYYRQAMDAFAHGLTNDIGLTLFHDCGLYELIRTSDREYQRFCLHPVISLLRSYDRLNKTDYYNTLETYLHCERSYHRTSGLMFVHRNTILYRIEKIKDTFKLDLDNTYEREYLLVSFYFDRLI